ncbi:MAG: type I-E CRISPR-associated protein Cas5/CasD [Oscillospiraceae bacterium]|jgi:CRISPR system Cascade subunit CasD|nr:type I-E CRISPR-associated protein Cas5/CasD [Oscillospiraceae bacterium]
MSTLLLRLAAPLQAWGLSRFNSRTTEREPTKSGVIGLLAASLGIRRDEPLDELLPLKFAVRVDQPGTFLRDFQTAKATNEKNPTVTDRYYLQDAVFVAAVEGDGALLARLEAALLNPAFPLYLGRRACPPELPLVLGIRELTAEDALRAEPWLARAWYREKHRGGAPSLEIIADAAPGETEAVHDALRDAVHDALRDTVRDTPISFAPTHRVYGFRYRRRERAAVVSGDSGTIAEHDPFAELEVSE